MISSRSATVKIDDYTLSSDGTPDGIPAKCFIEDGSRFGDVTGSHQTALDGTVYAQVAAQAGRGVSFGVRCEYLGVEVAHAIRDAVVDAFAAGERIRVTASDVFVNLDVYAIPDFTNGAWITYGSYSGGIMKDVRMRFISTGEAI